METTTARGLMAFIEKSPSAFHAVDNIKKQLLDEGFTECFEGERWHLEPGGHYFVTRNSSSVIAFKIGEDITNYNFQIVACHSDSPTFRLKEKAEILIPDKYLKLNVEGYGGMILSTWLDRPLSLAGRVMVKEGNTLHTRLLNIDRDLMVIPNVAIHMNRELNDRFTYNKQIDLLPLLGGKGSEKGLLKNLIADALDIDTSQIYGTDLQLYNRTKPAIWGANEEFFSSRQLDNLMSTYSTLQGFLRGGNQNSVCVYACFDNEEVGSGTKQGALSTFSQDVFKRINAALGHDEEDYYRALANGFMVSSDNAHAEHPNRPEFTDDENKTYLNQGVVVKSHAEQKYTSDAVSVAIFKAICESNHVPLQYFSNRSDGRGGSTLGNLMMTQASINTIDVGAPQLAMHSAYESAGMYDPGYLAQALEGFFNTPIHKEESGNYRLG